MATAVIELTPELSTNGIKVGDTLDGFVVVSPKGPTAVIDLLRGQLLNTDSEINFEQQNSDRALSEFNRTRLKLASLEKTKSEIIQVLELLTGDSDA